MTTPDETLGKIVALSMALKADGTHYTLREIDDTLGLESDASSTYKTLYPDLWRKHEKLLAESVGIRVQAALLDSSQLSISLLAPALAATWKMGMDEEVSPPTRQKCLAKVIDSALDALHKADPKAAEKQRKSLTMTLAKMDGLNEEIEQRKTEERKEDAEVS